MNKIIVPVDFSEHSEYALKMAAKLARKHKAKIFAIHMLEISETILTRGSRDLQAEALFFIKLAEKQFNEFLDKAYLEDIVVTPIIKHYKVFSELNEVAEHHEVDLIIMGSHGASGMKEVFVGSNTEKVVRHANIPVLVIKNDPEDINLHTAVFACDFSDEAIQPYKKAFQFFRALETNVQLVYVNLPHEHFRSSLEMNQLVSNFLNKADGNLDMLELVRYVSDYTVEKGILNFANTMDADFIAMATHGRKGLSHFFSGSISEDLANHSKLPVMTFKINSSK